MPRLVKGPDGITHTFPDDATDMEISAALEAHPAKPAKTWTDTIVDAIPAVGGAVGGIVGGIGGTVAGMGVGGVPGAIGGAALGGAAGESTRQLVNHARNYFAGDHVADAPTTPTAAATDIGEEGAIQGGMEAAGGLVAKGAEKLGTAVYRGYVKPSLSKIGLDKARDIVQTGIREWLPVTAGGEARAARLIGQINGQVESVLKNSSETVDLHAIADRVRSFAQKTFNRPGAPLEDFTAAMKVADEIDKHPALGLPAGASPTRVDVPVAQGNQVKQALDKAIGDTGFGVERTAETEARKAGRYAARDAIETKVPGVGDLNARESKLIDAMEAIQKAAGREENKNPLTGWGTTIVAGRGAGAMYGATHDPVSSLLTALAVKGAISPAVATNAAILAAKLGQSKAFPYGVSGALRTALVLAQRQEDQSNEARK